MFNKAEIIESQNLEFKSLSICIDKAEQDWLLENCQVQISFQGDIFIVIYSRQENGKNWTTMQWQTCDLQLVRTDEFTSLEGAKAHINRQIKTWLLDLLTQENN